MLSCCRQHEARANNLMAVSLAADWTGTTNLNSPAGGGVSPFAALASAAASDSFLDGSLPFSSISPDGERLLDSWGCTGSAATSK